MNKIILYLICSMLYVGNALANSLQSQIAAIAQAENEGRAKEQQAEDARKELIRQQVQAERVRREKTAAAAAAREKQRIAAENERRAKREAELANDKKRDQAYEDELRKLQLESMKLELQAKAARVQRENDFIEQELKERAAKTDVIQSEADANRNISSGSKELMQSEGKAREKKANSWW
ncbi:TPA: DUF5384 family protein [Escherichia coli]|nr:DUF5384 family protein [Escherichia coli]HBA7319378.1 hypothetical protein [Escherichia coli]